MTHALVLLCGGLSTRMGTNKAFLPFGKYTLIEYQVRRFRPYFEKIYLSVYPDDYDDPDTGNGTWIYQTCFQHELRGFLYTSDRADDCGSGYIFLYETVYGKYTFSGDDRGSQNRRFKRVEYL